MVYHKKVNKQQVYLQLAGRAHWSSGSDRDLRIISAGAKPPTRRAPDSIVIKLVLTIPGEAFDPIHVAAIDVPMENIERPVVELEDANA